MTPDDYRIRRRGFAICAGVSAVIFIGSAVPGWIFVWGPLLECRSSDGWKETTCTITTSNYKYDLGVDNKRYFHFAYDYTVDGRTWTGHRYAFTDKTVGRGDTHGMPPPLTLGQHRCFYDPTDPSKSVIKRSYSPEYRNAGLMLLLMSGVSLFMFCQWIRYYRNPQSMRFLT